MKNDGVKKDERLLAVLMNKYSISDIITILSSVDEKIIALHKCSSDDFLKLNDHFKKYFKDSKTLSDNATQIVGIITGKERNNYYKDLKAVHTNYEDIVSTLDSKIIHIVKSLNTLSGKISQLFIPVKNFRQNLMTIKFLFTNLELSESLSNNKTQLISQNESKRIDKLIEETKENYDNLNDSLNKIKECINTSIKIITDIKGNNIKNIESFLEQINSSLTLLSRKYDEATIKTPLLSDNTSDTSNSIAKIITNLQYQDIIRQKIEHIQQSHKSIIKDLSLMEMVNDQNTIAHNKLKTFIQLRDIAGLQAAQLIHANKQYQEAIESITGKFQEIGDNMNSISTTCYELSTPDQSTNSSIYIDILSKLEKAEGITGKLSQDNKNFYSELEFISKDTNDITAQYNKTKEVDNELSKTILSIIDSIDNKQNNNKDVTQLNTLYKDIQDSAKNTSDIIGQFVNISEDLQNYVQSLKKEESILEGVENYKKKVNTIISGIQENKSKVNTLLNQNSNISSIVSEEIKNIIKDVKYYDLFEKVIEEIINELNSINLKLKTDEPEQEQNKADNLDHIKKLYTMNSEHVIHEKMANSEEVTVDLFEDEELEQQDDDDDNLELF